MTRFASPLLPVVLVPGRPGTALLWAPLRAALVDAGLPVVDVEVDWSGPGPLVLDSVRDEVLRSAATVMAATGAPAVHLVGHGHGGQLVRELASGPLATVTATAVTVAARHAGPRPEPQPESRRCVLRRLSAVRQRPVTRWLSYYSDLDQVAPPALARLEADAFGGNVANHLIPGRGHLALCQDERLVRSIVDELVWTEGPPGTGAAAYGLAG